MKTKNPILRIITAYFMVFLLCCFFSCKNELSKDNALIVEKIKLLNKKEAVYTMTSRNKFGQWNFDIDFTDSINKFKVGDTIKLGK